MLTYEVVLFSTRHLPGRAKPYMIRWRVGTEPFAKSYPNDTQANGRIAQLLNAIGKGEQFDTETGLPVSELRLLKLKTTWYEHAKAYSAMKWPRASAKDRSARADALATVTPALVTSRTAAPDPAVLRTALSSWAFNHSPRQSEPPEPIARALAWITAKSLPVAALEDTELVRAGLDALLLKLDGTPAAANTATRKRNVFNNALSYAVQRRHLDVNPMQHVDWTPPETDDEVDFRYVPGPTQAAALIDAAPAQGPRGRHLAAFYACMYYAAMRPAEATDLRIADCKLPDSGWGELLLTGSSPSVSSRWTDDGSTHDERGLKRRARKATRDIPIPPELVTLLRTHIKENKPGPGGRVFSSATGLPVTSNDYSRTWKELRTAALTREQLADHYAEVPYSLRHAGVSFWLSSGVDPVEVARRAGHSVAVLYRFYAKILDGKREQANQKIDRALRDAQEAAERELEP